MMGLTGLAPARVSQAATGLPAVAITQVDVTDFPHVNVRVAVTGAPLGVPPAHLVVREHGAEVMPDQIVSQGERGPLTTLLAIDTSGSMSAAGKLAAAQNAALAFVDQMPAGDLAGVLAYNTERRYAQPVTADRVALRQALQTLTAQNDTALYDALLEGLQILATLPGRRALLLVTDGRDSRSTHTLGEVLTALDDLAAGPQGGIYLAVIGLGDPRRPNYINSALDEAALQTLVQRAGGTYVFAPDLSARNSLYRRLSQTLPSEYVLTYTSRLAGPAEVADALTVTLVDGAPESRASAPAPPSGALVSPGGSPPLAAQAVNLVARFAAGPLDQASPWAVLAESLAGLILLTGVVALRLRRRTVAAAGPAAP
ncbi:MAG: VWA domain-containing protein, partial [Anaerolineales bacterium]|nr:VWA domain-containing protein [Anaerolineales bacterium]